MTRKQRNQHRRSQLQGKELTSLEKYELWLIKIGVL